MPPRSTTTAPDSDFRPAIPAANTSSLFKGNSLTEELAFSFYYHSKLPNQLLHAASIPFLFLGVLMMADSLLLESKPAVDGNAIEWHDHGMPFSTLPALLAAAVVLRFATWDLLVAAVWSAMSVAWITLIQTKLRFISVVVATLFVSVLPENAVLICGFILALSALLLQIAGHVIFERRLPAFRLFEAAVTTPFLCTLIVLQKVFGYRASEMGRVAEVAPKWKGTERRVF